MRKNDKLRMKKLALTGLSLLLITSAIPSHWLKPYEKILPSSMQDEKILALATNFDSVQITGGDGYSLILKENGTVSSFGRNDLGQLGLNDTIDRSAPTTINPSYFNNEKVVKIEASTVYAVAITETNQTYFWGNGTTKPTKMYGKTPVIDIDVSGTDTHTAINIVTDTGEIVSSGSNYYGQFGDGLSSYGAYGLCTTQYSSSVFNFAGKALLSATINACSSNPSVKYIEPGTETPLTGIIDVDINAHKRYSLARTAQNQLYIWGEGKQSFATLIPSSTNYNIVKIAAGNYPSFLTDDGKLFYYSTINNPPIQITLENSSEKIVDIKSGDQNLIILTESGQLFGIGPNTYGNLGSTIPATGVNWTSNVAGYTGIDNVQRIGVGLDHTLLQFKDDRFATLGRNSYGQLSVTDINSKNVFTKNPNISDVKLIEAERYSSFAVTSDNKFYSWGGTNANERLKAAGDQNVPGLVKDFGTISNVIDLDGHSYEFVHGSILLENNTAWVYGHPSYVGLGSGSSTWGPILLKNNNTDLSGRTFNIQSVSQGYFDGVALTDDNKIYTWGWDANRMLGLGYAVTRINAGAVIDGYLEAFQEPVVPNESWSKVYSGDRKSFLLTNEGKVYAWGSNGNSLGLSTASAPTATLVNTLPPIKDIVMGIRYNLFLDYQGNVWAAGSNNLGQLGIGNTTTANIPTKIPTLSNVKSIGAGSNSSYAILENGDLYAWGDNRYGNLGLGDMVQRNEPRKVEGISNVKKVVGGLKHTIALTESGEIYVTGSDSDGQLGLGQSQYNAEPIITVFPPTVTINNVTNQNYTQADTLVVSGNIASQTPGVNMNVTYSLESQDGKTTFPLKSYTTSDTPEPISFSIPFDSSYKLGSYTLKVITVSDSGVKGEASINFGIQDLIKPTVSVDISSLPKWQTTVPSIAVTANDTGGSGYRGYRYALTTSTTLPTIWSPVIPKTTDSVLLDVSGALYLHIEAYDNIGNVKYLMAGPYYVDTSKPDFIFTEPVKWQQDQLDLGVTLQEASNVVTKKWLPGTATLDDVKANGNILSTSTIPISWNGIYSFYAKDENNQESLETYNVSNINYTPLLLSSPSSLLVPSYLKSSYGFTSDLSHSDDNDLTKMVMEVNGNTITSTNSHSGQTTNQTMNWNGNFSSVSENTLYTGQLYLKDSRGGLSSKKNTQIEVYNPNLTLKSKLSGMDISWTHSKLSQTYRLLKDGEVIYSGTNNSFVDQTNDPNSLHTYRLEVLWNGAYIQVSSTNKNDGYNKFETASFIQFPDATLGDTDPITPVSADLEYMKYQDFSDINTACTISVSMTDFTSDSSSFTAQSFVLKNVKKLNRASQVEKVLPDVYLSSTPFEMISQTDTGSDAYVKLELLKNNIELTVPPDIHLNNKPTETFQSTITWDVTIAP
ncbi:hypothetical protein MZM54_05120 [[Brevibacterium] frigoritolerans]|nr:hypothetical protein [Peribacillus frigoritolerans]